MTYQMPEVSLLGKAEELVQITNFGPLLETDRVTQTQHVYPGN